MKKGTLIQFRCDTLQEFLERYDDISKRWAHPEKHSEFKALLLQNGQVNGYEVEVHLIDGTTKWFALYANSADDGTIINGFSLDITGLKDAEMTVRQNEILYRSLFENMFSGAILVEVIMDATGKPVDHRLLQTNHEFVTMTGLDIENQLGKISTDLRFKWPPEIAQSYYDVALGGIPIHWERYNESVQRHYDVRVYSPQLGQFAMLFNDITERKEEEQELHKYRLQLEELVKERTDFLEKANQELMLMEITFNETSDGLMIANADATIIKANSALCAITDYSENELLGQHSTILLPNEQKAFYNKLLDNLAIQDNWIGESWIRKKDGTAIPVSLILDVVKDQAGATKYFICALIDISEQRIIKNQLEQAIARTKRHQWKSALFFMDLDGFKQVNDTYGHEAGDAVLVEISKWIMNRIRSSDTIARLGGDEFTVIIEDIKSKEDIIIVADAIMAESRRPFLLNGQLIQLSSSIGIAVIPDDAYTVDDAIQKADTAMCVSKRLGRGCFSFVSGGAHCKIIEG